jgi:hypothetical protein
MDITLDQIKSIAYDIISDKEWSEEEPESIIVLHGVKSGLERLIKQLEDKENDNDN